MPRHEAKLSEVRNPTYCGRVKTFFSCKSVNFSLLKVCKVWIILSYYSRFLLLFRMTPILLLNKLFLFLDNNSDDLLIKKLLFIRCTFSTIEEVVSANHLNKWT